MSGQRKPTVQELGIDVDALSWQATSAEPGCLEVAFTGDWVLLRGGDGGDRVLVFDHHEWDSFVRGVKDHEFDGHRSPSGET